MKISCSRRKTLRKAIGFLERVVSKPEQNGLCWMIRDKTGLAPLHVRAWERMADAYLELGNKRKAAECMRNARKAADEVLCLQRGIKLMRSRRLGEAIKMFGQALKINKTCPVALVNIGCAHLLRKEYGDAMKWFEEAIEVDDSCAEAWELKGRLLELFGRGKEADECYGKIGSLLENENERLERMMKVQSFETASRK